MNSVLKRFNDDSLSTIILAILKEEDNYGLELSLKIKLIIPDEMKWSKTTVYPLLKELEKGKLIRSYWRIEDKTHPRKYYSLLEKGIEQLAAEEDETEIFDIDQ